ncbi:MAG: hypothetical protein WB626_01500, partial [Bacteroidota bacterium]
MHAPDTEYLLLAFQKSAVGDREGVSLQEVMEASLPRVIKGYLHTEVVRALEQDIAAARRFGRVRDAQGALPSVVVPLLRASALHYRFPRAEFVASLDNAFHFALNLLSRPRWTILELVFAGGARVPVRTLEARLEFVAELEQERSLLVRILRRRDRQDVSRTFVSRCLAEMDRRRFSRDAAGALAQAAQPLFDFFAFAPEGASGAVPVPLLGLFLADRDRPAEKDYLERICHIRSRRALLAPEFEGIL